MRRICNLHVVRKLQQLRQNRRIDVVYVALLNHMHCASVCAALRHRRPVLCEKPLGVNAKEVQLMIATAQRYNTFLMEVRSINATSQRQRLNIF